MGQQGWKRYHSCFIRHPPSTIIYHHCVKAKYLKPRRPRGSFWPPSVFSTRFYKSVYFLFRGDLMSRTIPVLLFCWLLDARHLPCQPYRSIALWSFCGMGGTIDFNPLNGGIINFCTVLIGGINDNRGKFSPVPPTPNDTWCISLEKMRYSDPLSWP